MNKFCLGTPLIVCSLAAICGTAVARADEPLDAKEKAALAKKLNEKVAETGALNAKAAEVTKRLGELATSGKIPNSNEAIELMRKMVEEMAAIRAKLEGVEAEVSNIQGWIAGHKEKPAAQGDQDLDILKKTKPFGFLQTQYRDTNLKGGANDAFAVRRMRVGLNHQADERTSLRVSWDLSTGTSQQTTVLKDAFVSYMVDPKLTVTAGQHTIPLGYDIIRGDTDREFPERAQYNQKLFNGERSQGVSAKYDLGNGATFHVGGWNALFALDPEQANSAPGGEDRLAVSAGLRYKKDNFEGGVAGFRGERPKFTTGSGTSAVVHPRADREFILVDAAYNGFLTPKLSLRGEAMFGKDRLPATGAPAAPLAQTDMAGFQVQAGYAIDAKNALHVRFEQFDPDTDSNGNAIIGYGAVWSHYLTPSVKLSAAHEIFDDAARSGTGVRQQRYHITTLRVQFKF